MPSLYEISIPVFIRGLTQLLHILKKGEAYADEKGIPHSKFLEARLVDDMYALPAQIQRVSDTAKLSAVRLAGVESVPMADNETTFEDLQARIQKTIDFLQKVGPADFEGKDEDAVLVVKAGSSEYKSTYKKYLLEFGLPNFFFHVTVAYSILRHMGVPVGKMDYLGNFRRSE